jgi:hypothetical protein
MTQTYDILYKQLIKQKREEIKQNLQKKIRVSRYRNNK